MKTKKTEKAPASKSKKMTDEMNRSRKMQPLKSKELKNLHFDSEEDEEVDPETMDENFKGFEDFDGVDEDEEDF